MPVDKLTLVWLPIALSIAMNGAGAVNFVALDRSAIRSRVGVIRPVSSGGRRA
jgi:hypothetical protein